MKLKMSWCPGEEPSTRTRNWDWSCRRPAPLYRSSWTRWASPTPPSSMAPACWHSLARRKASASCCAATWTRCQFRRKPACPLPPATPARCTLAATTCTPPSCWAPPSCSRNARVSCADQSSCYSSLEKKSLRAVRPVSKREFWKIQRLKRPSPCTSRRRSPPASSPPASKPCPRCSALKSRSRAKAATAPRQISASTRSMSASTSTWPCRN